MAGTGTSRALKPVLRARRRRRRRLRASRRRRHLSWLHNGYYRLKPRWVRIERQSVFIWIPKTAGSSLFEALHRVGCRLVKTDAELARYFDGAGCFSFGHMDYLSLVGEDTIDPVFGADAFRFTVVRDPYDRAVSLWAYWRGIGKIPAEVTFATFVTMLSEPLHPLGVHNADGNSQLHPQTAWIARDGKVAVDLVMRFEHINDDAKVLAAELGLPSLELPTTNSSDRGSADEYYTPALRRQVAEVWASDFELLGYEP